MDITRLLTSFCRRRIRPVLGLALLISTGCAKVEPGPDFQRASELIAERTGSEWVYTPHSEILIEEQIQNLLGDDLTVEEAVRVALLNNRALHAAFEEIGVSRAALVQAGLLSNPSLSLMFKLAEGGGIPLFEMGLGQELADLWQIPARKRVAAADLEAAILSVANQAVNLAADVRVRAYELLALERAEAILRESLALAERAYRLAQQQFEAGTVSQLDVNLSRTNIIEVQLELIALQRERQVLRVGLGRLLNLNRAGLAWQIRDDLPEPRPVAADGLLGLALDQRLDARMAEARAQAAEAALRREYLEIFPSLELGFALERSARRAQPGRNLLADTARASIAAGRLTAPDIESRAQRAQARREIIDVMLGPSLAMTLPIFDQNQAQIAGARHEAIQRRKEYEQVLEQVAADVAEAAAVARNAEELVRFYDREALPQAAISVEGAEQRYQAGAESILPLLNATESLIVRRRAYVRALGQYAVAMAELERAAGGRLPSEPISTQSAAEPPATQPAEANAAPPEPTLPS